MSGKTRVDLLRVVEFLDSTQLEPQVSSVCLPFYVDSTQGSTKVSVG